MAAGSDGGNGIPTFPTLRLRVRLGGHGDGDIESTLAEAPYCIGALILENRGALTSGECMRLETLLRPRTAQTLVCKVTGLCAECGLQSH